MIARVRRKIKNSSCCNNALTYFVEQIFCKVLVITPGPLCPQISPRKFFFKSRTHMSMTRRPSGVMSNPITPAATSSQSSAPAKFVKRSRDLRAHVFLPSKGVTNALLIFHKVTKRNKPPLHKKNTRKHQGDQVNNINTE